MQQLEELKRILTVPRQLLLLCALANFNDLPNRSMRVENSLERRARNLYIISGVIIVYLLAGADLENLTLLGIRSPSRYPIVFSFASVLGLLWFGWRYSLSWKEQRVGQTFRQNFLRELQQTTPFLLLINNNVNHAQILASAWNIQVNDPCITATSMESYVHKKTPSPGSYISKSSIEIQQIKYLKSDGKSSGVGIDHFPDNTFISIDVPWKLHYRHSPALYWSKAWNQEAFSTQRFPVVAFFLAILLILCKSFGGDPAGVWGLMPSN